MAAEAPLQRFGELVVPDGTARVFEALRDDPTASVGCLYHPNVFADVIFATPEGSARNPESRISPFCRMHIFNENHEPMIALLDLSRDGHWSELAEVTPLMERDSLEGYEAVLAKVFKPETPIQMLRRWPGILKNYVQGFSRSDT